MPEIKCSVDSCAYWGKGNICQAEAIEVAKNFKKGADFEAGTLGSKNLKSNETKCVTFKPKNK